MDLKLELVPIPVSDVDRSIADRLGRACTWIERVGRPEREVLAAADGAGLLVVGRDGDLAHLGPASLGPAGRFVVGHAPARSCSSGLARHPAVPPSRRTRRAGAESFNFLS